MNIQIKDNKWYTPQELAKLMRRTMNEAYMIIKNFGCDIKAKDERIIISGKDVLEAMAASKGKNRRQDV